MNADLVNQLAKRVTPLGLDLDAPFDDLDSLTNQVPDAKVVGLGLAVRHSHELSTLAHRLVRFLIDQHGFRSLELEGDETASLHLDTYVRSGQGDPLLILAGARTFWRFAEILEAVRWVRARNERNPDDQVRIVHDTEQRQRVMHPPVDRDEIERHLAESTIAWHERTGDRIVYWGGLAHTAKGLATGNNLGSFLRARFGSGYLSIAMTFHHGALPSIVDIPPADNFEAVLGGVDLETYILNIGGNWPQSVREWLDAPAKTRLIGPGTHELLGPPLRSWFDFVVHSRRVTPAHSL